MAAATVSVRMAVVFVVVGLSLVVGVLRYNSPGYRMSAKAPV